MFRVDSDWDAVGTAEEIVEVADWPNIMFHGPGFYISDTFTILVIPVADFMKETRPWKQRWPKEQRFRVFFWQCPLHQTIFAAVGSIPSRLDLRS